MHITRSLRIITGAYLIIGPLIAAAATLNLRVGEVKTLRPGVIDRIAVGSAEMLSTSLLKNGQLLVFGEGEGVSSMRIWLLDGEEIHYEVFVEGFEFLHARGVGSLATKTKEVQNLLGQIPGIVIERIGSRIALTGQYDGQHAGIVTEIKTAYPEILDLTLSTKYAEVVTILGETEGLEIGVVGERIILSGEVDESLETKLEALAGAYPEILDLTVKRQLELLNEQMVLMSIKITEFNSNTLDALGINWGIGDTVGSFNGPAGVFASERSSGRASAGGLSVTNGSTAPSQLAAGPVGARQSIGYFGIATEITSRINVAVSSGEAVILASPRLVARNGGSADFLAGGEIPIEIVTPTSAAIEFKQFGILLNIQPEVDRNGNILATVKTEISAVDNSVSIGGVPGFLTRRTSADISMRAGETLVMSGLMNQEVSEDMSGLKGLSSIPVIGRLFRSESFRDRKTELVIFVTPEVYDAKSVKNTEAITRRNDMLEQFQTDIDRSSLELLD